MHAYFFIRKLVVFLAPGIFKADFLNFVLKNLGFLVLLSYKPLSYKKNKRVGIPRSSLASPSVKSDGVS